MKFSLSKINFLNIFFILLLFSIILGIFIYQFNEEVYNKKVVLLEKNYYEKNKAIIKYEVKRAVKRIDVLKNLVYEKNELLLKEKVVFIKNLFNSNLKVNNFDEILLKYKKELNLFKWDNGSGYFYIFDKNGKVLFHGGNKKYVNLNIFKLSESNKELYNFLKDSIVQDENFGTYKWYKPNEKPNELHSKYVYVKKDEKYNIFIAAGVYKDELDKEIKKLVFENLEKDRFGDSEYGYFWLIGLDNILKMHPFLPHLVGKDQSNMKSLDGKSLMDKMKEAGLRGGDFIKYKVNRPDNNQIDEKISYTELLYNWDIAIGAGFYRSELNNLIKEEKNNLKEISDEYISDIFMILFVLIFAALIIAKYISLKIDLIEVQREEQMNMLEQYKFILDKSSVVSKTDKNGIITYVNNSFEKISGYNKAELIGKTHRSVSHADTPKSQFKELWKTISKGKTWKGILKNKTKEDKSYYSSITIVPIKDSFGNIVEYISSGNIVTELIENRTKLQSLFKTDVLTGLRNRVSLIDDLTKSSSTLVLIDIDRFKEINDSYSHFVGDEIIKAFANRLFDYFNDRNYILYRVQADVFALVIDKSTVDNVFKDVSEFIDTLGQEAYFVKDDKFILSYTCGIASNSENLLTYADIALDEAKNKKVRIKEYSDSMADIKKFRDNIQWVDRLHKAINEDRIFPHYQPIYNYKTGKIDKYEALMRLEENGKIIYPNEYLEIAKRTKLYTELTYKMIEKAISKFSTNDLEFSINLSVEDLMNEELMIYLFDYAEQKDVFNRMVLEIVESEEIEDSDYVNKLVKRFKDNGAKIAIDDFGCGYSNYEYLITLQADYLKIDGSIIKLIPSDTRTQDVVKSILEFSRKSNIKVIAEFVSDENIDKILREIGVDYAQGFYYGKPEVELVDEIS
ncbi:MAG: hypothetical protein C0626_10065 [Arcobacter sp.]|uniref:EAL domain-containing protein n=1 Tax=uncultured Arcobacter sp. TaxID=165434 RepID=UPI000CA6F3F1|nr:EAL domain-containing protein [uncultured Arcobacter sp.]PLY09329.1 MAG: hypothetical protein C0626_10065 [Arcobacter sp.]